MKKVFNFLFIVTLIFVLSSCGFKKEIEAPEIDGDKMSKSKVESFYKEYEDYCKKISEGDKTIATTKGWYSVAGNLTYTINNDDEKNPSNTTVKVKLSGDMYDSNYAFDKMMHLTVRLEIETEGKEKEDAKHIKGKYEVFLKEGMSWVKGSFSSKAEEEKENTKIYVKGSFSELLRELPDEVTSILNFGKLSSADMQAVGHTFMQQLKNVDEETTSVYQKGDKYTIQADTNTLNNDNTNDDGIKVKSIIEVEFKDVNNYIAKKYNAYCDMESSFGNSDMKASYEISVKNKGMGVIIPPIFEGKYRGYDDSEIFPEL